MTDARFYSRFHYTHLLGKPRILKKYNKKVTCSLGGNCCLKKLIDYCLKFKLSIPGY